MFHVKPHAPYELEAIPRKLKLAKEIRDLFQPLSSYIPQNHKGRAHPLTQIHNAYHMPIDTSEYLVNRAYYSKLYKSMRGADISHQDILAIWGNPYIGVVTKWSELSYQRQQNILKDYPGSDGIASRINEAKQYLTFELAAADYDTKQFIQDVVIVGLSVWTEKQFKLPNTLMAPVYATRMERALAYIQPKYEKIAYKLSDRAGKLCKKAEDFFKRKGAETAKKRTIPTAQSKVDWHVKMVQSGKWKPCRGEWKGYYEGEIKERIYRFKPTFEKNEYEVYKKYSNKGQHCSVFRTEGERALEIIEELAKNTIKGKW